MAKLEEIETMEYDVEELKESPDGLNHEQAGWYVFNRDVTDATFEDLTWNDRGNGPEPTEDGVFGPFVSGGAARHFWVIEVIECCDEGDLAPGEVTWDEWLKWSGLTRPAIRSLCPKFMPCDFKDCPGVEQVIYRYQTKWAEAVINVKALIDQLAD